MWRFLQESITGTGHLATDQPCQDFRMVSAVGSSRGDYLIIACADGAGSAKHSDQGSRLACTHAVSSLADQIASAVDIGEHSIRDLFKDVASLLQLEAEKSEATARDFACTLLIALIGPSSSLFAQLGDGAIVARKEDKLVPVFWPQTGEYHNTTYFVTEPSHHTHVMVSEWAHSVDEIAVMTDGLQMLALSFADQSAHQPFFLPFFKALKAALSVDDLHVPFRQFLASDEVNARTDDDKTLVIAVKVDGEDAPR